MFDEKWSSAAAMVEDELEWGSGGRDLRFGFVDCAFPIIWAGLERDGGLGRRVAGVGVYIILYTYKDYRG